MNHLNIPHVSIVPISHGHWRVSMNYQTKIRTFTTTSSTAVDDYNCDPTEKDGGTYRKMRGYKRLKRELTLQLKQI